MSEKTEKIIPIPAGLIGACNLGLINCTPPQSPKSVKKRKVEHISDDEYKSTASKYNCVIGDGDLNGPTCKLRKMALNLYYLVQDHYISEDLFRQKVSELRNETDSLCDEILEDYAVLKSAPFHYLQDVHSDQYTRRCRVTTCNKKLDKS